MARVVVKGSRWKSALLFLVGAAFVLLMVQPWLAGKREPGVYFGLIFFGLCALVGGAYLIFPPSLILTDEGFTCKGFGRGWSRRWADIDELFLWENPGVRWPASQKLVAWSYRPGREPKKAMVKISAALGAPGALPGMWSLGPAKLLELMQSYHRRNSPPGVGAPSGPASSGHEPEQWRQ